MIIEIWIKRRKGAALAFHIYPNYNPVKSFFFVDAHISLCRYATLLNLKPAITHIYKK